MNVVIEPHSRHHSQKTPNLGVQRDYNRYLCIFTPLDNYFFYKTAGEILSKKCSGR